MQACLYGNYNTLAWHMVRPGYYTVTRLVVVPIFNMYMPLDAIRRRYVPGCNVVWEIICPSMERTLTCCGRLTVM